MTNQTERRSKRMQEKLEHALAPTILTIIDESIQHHGHANAATGLGYFAVHIASLAFLDKSLVECHRLVYAALGDMMQTDIHALRIIMAKKPEN